MEQRVEGSPKGGNGGGQDNKFEVTISYNGLAKTLEVNRNQAVQAVLSRSLELFASPTGDLRLFIGGTELQTNVSVEAAGIKPGSQLLLRPRRVRGG
ncbi:MAG: hypothetical protein IT539_04545 [Bradyrhizobiaceae bacterium]|nr:hypothetical protein [Bradyrhizobiaceae bacterium]